VKNGAQTVFEAHIGVNKFFFSMDQYKQVDEPEKAAAEKNDKGHPGQRTAHKTV
jgi:hypothetical protein